MSSIKIIDIDSDLVVVQKPPGIHVHPTELSPGEVSCKDLLESELNERLYPIHRIDRPVSGLVIFARHPAAAAHLNLQFRQNRVEKFYVGITRGKLPLETRIAAPLTQKKNGPSYDAWTRVARLETTSHPHPVGRHQIPIYSLGLFYPETGRTHQIRRHLKRTSCPLIGDKIHGDRDHNRHLAEYLKMDRLFLHAAKLRIQHPYREIRVEWTSTPDPQFDSALVHLGWSPKKLRSLLHAL